MEFNGLSLAVLVCLGLSSSSLQADNSIPLEKKSILLQAKKPALLLATNFQQDTDIGEFLVSEKLDGVRAYWDGSKLVSRAGNIIYAPDWFVDKFPTKPMDGELWMGRGQFDKLSGIVRTKIPNDSDWKELKYHVFDLPSNQSVFSQRTSDLAQLITSSGSQYLYHVEQLEFIKRSEFNNYLGIVVAKGGEGVMLHRKKSLYRAYRHTDLQKLKPFDDAEALVVGHLPGKGKYQGMMGAIKVMTDSGVLLNIGSGFSVEERRSPPPVDSIITYRYRGMTSKGTPRFATFLRMKTD